MQHEVATKEHEWLQQLVGEWSFEAASIVEDGQPSITHAGTESVRALGPLWVLCEGRTERADGGADLTVMTLGFDATKQRFVGTFIGSMMSYLWVYEGTLDPSGTVLTLDCAGPSFEEGAGIVPYTDVIELKGADQRVLWAQVQREDGTWHRFMTSNYRRTA